VNDENKRGAKKRLNQRGGCKPKLDWIGVRVRVIMALFVKGTLFCTVFVTQPTLMVPI
jgi:hypothetical protein